MKSLRLLVAALFISGLTHSGLRAAEISSYVKYVSASEIYIESGASDGIKRGDKCRVMRDAAEIAVLEVTYTASASAACRILEKKDDVRVGDVVVVEIVAPVAVPAATPALADTTHAAPLKVAPTRRAKQPQGTRWSGRLGFDYYAQIPRETGSLAWNQPSLSLRGRIYNIAGSSLQLNVRLRARRLNRTYRGAKDQWNSRLYELSLADGEANSRYQWSLGRIQPSGVSGVGYLDGSDFNYGLSDDWRWSLFAGVEPDPVTSGISADKMKAGSIIRRSSPVSDEFRFASSLALVGVYDRGAIDREYMYLVNQLSSLRQFSLDQSAEIQVNRGWRKDASGSTFQLSGFLLSGSYAAASWLNFSGGFSHWRNVRDAADKSIPDSLWLDAARDGWRMGCDARLASELRAYASGSIGSGEGASGKSASGGISYRESHLTNIAARISTAFYSSPYGNGRQGSISLSRSLFDILDLGAEYGMARNRLKSWQSNSDRHWLNFSANAWLSRRLYLSGSYELDRGDLPAADQMTVSGGIRF